MAAPLDDPAEVVNLGGETSRMDLQSIAGATKKFMTPDEAFEHLSHRCNHSKEPYMRNLEAVLVEDKNKTPSSCLRQKRRYSGALVQCCSQAAPTVRVGGVRCWWRTRVLLVLV